MVVPQCCWRYRPRRNIEISSRPKAVTPSRRSVSASSRALPHRCTAAITVCQPAPSSAAISLIARPMPARRVACRAARAVTRALGGAIPGSWSVNVATSHDPSGHRHHRLVHTSQVGRPNTEPAALIPKKTKARSFARHEASEALSQTHAGRRHNSQHECEAPVNACCTRRRGCAGD